MNALPAMDFKSCKARILQTIYDRPKAKQSSFIRAKTTFLSHQCQTVDSQQRINHEKADKTYRSVSAECRKTVWQRAKIDKDMQ